MAMGDATYLGQTGGRACIEGEDCRPQREREPTGDLIVVSREIKKALLWLGCEDWTDW